MYALCLPELKVTRIGLAQPLAPSDLAHRQQADSRHRRLQQYYKGAFCHPAHTRGRRVPLPHDLRCRRFGRRNDHVNLV